MRLATRILRILFALAFLSILPGVLAFGISPGQRTIEPAGVQQFSFRPVLSPGETGTITVSASGDLAGNIALEKTTLLPGEEIHGNITIPADLAPGTHSQSIIITLVPDAREGTVSGQAAVAGMLNIKVPYPEEYLTASWDISTGSTPLITVTLENLGSKEVTPQSVQVDVGEERVSLTPPLVPVQDFGQTQAAFLPQHPGEYNATLHVLYAERTITLAKAARFGSPRITLATIAYQDEAGEVKPIDMSGMIDWNIPLELDGTVYIDNGTVPAATERFTAQGAFTHRFYVTTPRPHQVRVVITALDTTAEARTDIPPQVRESHNLLWIMIAGMIVLLAAAIIFWELHKK